MSKTSVDESLVYAARSGDETAMARIVEDMASVVEIIASENIGDGLVSRSDLIQEGMLGLLRAVYGYRADGGASFKTYASVCILNAVKRAGIKQSPAKEIFVDSTISLDEIDKKKTVSVTDPQTIFSMQSGMIELMKLIETELTALERDSLKLHAAGYNNREISDIIKVKEKSVDNALQRARRKLKEKWIP